MHMVLFWAACAAVLFTLQLLSLHLRLQQSNTMFSAWLAAGVVTQLVAAEGLSAHRPHWYCVAGGVLAPLTFALACGALAESILRYRIAVNQTIAVGMGAMVMCNILSLVATRTWASSAWSRLDLALGIDIIDLAHVFHWLRNIGFWGPALWMLLSFSGLGLDRLRISDCLLPLARIVQAAGWARVVLG